MKQREHLKTLPVALQRPNEGVGWQEQHSYATGQVLVFMEKCRGVLAAPQLGRQSEGGHILLLLPTCIGLGQPYVTNLIANMTLSNHIMIFYTRISASSSCFVRKLN